MLSTMSPFPSVIQIRPSPDIPSANQSTSVLFPASRQELKDGPFSIRLSSQTLLYVPFYRLEIGTTADLEEYRTVRYDLPRAVEWRTRGLHSTPCTENLKMMI